MSRSCARSTRPGNRATSGRPLGAHPEIEWFALGKGEKRTGLAGTAAGTRTFLAAWEDFKIEAEEVRELDHERVLVLDKQSGRGRTSGLEIGTFHGKGAVLFHLADGKVTRLVIYPTRENALADLGLTPEGGSP